MRRNRRNSKRAIKGRGAYYPGGRVLKGRGGFFDDLAGIARGIAGPVVGAVSKAIDGVIPGAGSVTQGIAKLVGMGAYTPVRSNAILAQPVPKVGSATDKGIRYQHQEFLGDVTSSADWELTQFRVNPGLPESFPWLSTIASSFQKYRINGLVFYLRSTSSVAIASTDNLALGTVLGAFQYNVYDAPPTSKVDMLALSGSLSGKPSEDHIYAMECAPSKNPFDVKLVRHTGVVDDVAKYDHAIFNLATYGFPGEYALGELWVSYDITLMAPKIEDALPYITIGTTGGGGLATDVTDYPVASPAAAHSMQLLPASGSIDPTATHTIQNTLGWDVVNAADGHPCMRVPAGTTGYFQFVGNIYKTGGTMAFVLNTLSEHMEVLEGSGAITSVLELPGNTLLDSAATQTVTWRTFHVAALPDKPLLFRWLFETDGGARNGTYACEATITRLSDTIVKPSGGTRGVVLTASKVRRLPARPVLATLPGSASYQFAPRAAQYWTAAASSDGVLRAEEPQREVTVVRSAPIAVPARALTAAGVNGRFPPLSS